MAGHIKNHDRMYDCTYCSHFVVFCSLILAAEIIWLMIHGRLLLPMDHAGIKISIQPSSIDIILPFGNFLIFTLNERTTHKKLYAHISRIFYCNCWYTKIYDFLSNQNRVPSIIVCQNESFYGKTSWLIVLKEKCCWNDLMLKGGGKRRRTDRKHLQKRKELMPSTLLYF